MIKGINIDELPSLVKEFATYKTAIQNCSAKTVSEYLLDLRTFFRFLIARQEKIDYSLEEFENIDIRGVDLEYIKNITSEDIYDFLLYADSVRGNMEAAKSRKLSSVKGFFKYLSTKRMMLDVNPAADIEAPKRSKTLPKFLSLEESLELLNAVKNDKESKTVDRDYAIITIFLNCGIRVSELTGINLEDIDRKFRSMTVTGKGNKQRIVYLNDACREALQVYAEERMSPKYEKCKTNAFFLSSRAQRISVKTVQWMVYKYLDMAGLESKHYSVHKLRHTAATLMYQTGNVDVRVLKDILGHEQLNTTQIYTHVSNKSMEDAMKNNPLSSQSAKKQNEPE